MINWAKAKLCVYADSVLCVVKMEQNPGAADAKWTGQIEDLKRNPSYQDAVGLHGAIFATLTILTKIHTDMERKENRTGELQRLDYVTSVFNDISWKKNDENCILNAEKVKNYSKRLQPGHWTLLGSFSERDGTVAHMMDNGTATTIKRNWSSCTHSH